MQGKVIVEYTREGIAEVKTIWDDSEANQLLLTGKWILMHAGCAHRDIGGFQAKPVYILARVKEVI
jgi:hydrogenase maturation factor